MEKTKYQIHFEQWKDTYREYGIEFGYPRCCIDEFLSSKSGTPGKDLSPSDSALTKHYGFIPCEKCRAKIRAGKVTLEGLIKNRIHPNPFPNSD